MPVKLFLFAIALAVAAGIPAAGQEAQDPAIPAVLDLRERAAVRDAWLARRLETVVPTLMARENVDMWVLIAREYNEDPVLETMLPATWLSARRRTILLFYRLEDGSLERLSVSRYAVGEVFEAAWTPEEQPDQWARLAEIVAERDPRRIAVSRSGDFPLADGLTDTEAAALEEALGERYVSRLVSGENLAVGWLETRIPEEMTVYPQIVRLAHAIIAEGLSERVITPGVTTADDVMWWYRERIRELKLRAWFHPSVSIQRNEGSAGESSSTAMTDLFANENPNVIRPGDLLHVDFGIEYLGLHTDTQHHAYVLRAGETEAPAGLKAGLAQANRLQDLLAANFEAGASGNEILARTREQALGEGLTPSIYSHPIGYHGHGAGGSIGMWDDQDGRPGPGEYPIRPDTAWSIELNIEAEIPEWDGRQSRFHLIGRP